MSAIVNAETDQSPTIRIDHVATLELPVFYEIETRAEIDESVVAEYRERMLAGDRFPPITVFFDGESHILADGYHRLMAALDAGMPEIEVEFKVGSIVDAMRYGLETNGKHGLRPTVEDLRVRVPQAMRAGVFFPENIANHLHCSTHAVSHAGGMVLHGVKPAEPYRLNARGQRRPTKYRRRKGPDPMATAEKAIGLLESIEPDDPDRLKAIRHVEARAAYLRTVVPHDDAEGADIEQAPECDADFQPSKDDVEV